MNENQIRHFARILNVQLSNEVQTTGWIQGSCPFARWTHESGHDNNFSFGIRINRKGRSGFKCFACGQSGTIPKLAFDLGRFRGIDLVSLGREIEIAEITGTDYEDLPDWDEVDNGETENQPVRDDIYEEAYPPAIGHPYLTKRGVTWKSCYKLRLRYDSSQQRILFPVYDDRGRFRGFSGRYCGDKKLPKWNPKVRDYLGLPKRELFLGEHVFGDTASRRHRKPEVAVIVEGLFDYARLQGVIGRFYKRKVGVLCILGTEITKPKEQKLLGYDVPLIWMVDNDLAGRKVLYGKIDPNTKTHNFETGMLHRFYGKVPQLLVRYPKRLIQNRAINDPGECTDNELLQMIVRAKLFVK